MGTPGLHPNQLLMPAVFLATGIVATAGWAEETGSQELPSWGNTAGATAPQPDSKGRSGYWWWPIAEMDAGFHRDVAGNRGRVFGRWQKPSETSSVNALVPPPVPYPQGPKPICGGPIINYMFFDHDSAELREEGKLEVGKLVEQLKQYAKDTVVCIGHTDDVGPEAYNLKLGERRAQAVKNCMVEQGVSAERISIKSMGETRPAVSNDSPANRALNRRVEFEITIGQ